MHPGEITDERNEYLDFKNLIGKSPVFIETIKLAKKALASNTTIIILGESGTGKELLAKAIHYNSPRGYFPMVALNCAAFPEPLLESELFGYEKGAFTGAEKTKPGCFEMAGGGTLFLDEIGDMNLALQAKMLRVLQEHEFMRLGGTRSVRVDVRLITATNKDLTDLLNKGMFRHDLYYRVNVFPIIMPPLRERRDDIPILLNYFLEKYSARLKKNIKGISPAAMNHLKSYNWLGNIRELQNALERAVILCKHDIIVPEDLPNHICGHLHYSPLGSSYFTLPPDGIILDKLEKDLLIQALERAHYNKTKSAKLLGLSRSCLRYRLKKFHLE